MSLCQTNPLNTLLSKSSQYHYGGVRPEMHGASAGGSSGQTTMDRQFGMFAGESAGDSVGAAPSRPFYRGDAPMNAQLKHTNQTGPRSMGAMDHGWVDQFSRMQVRDQSEFSNEYKQMYAQYESTSNVGRGVGGLVGRGNVSVSLPIASRQNLQINHHNQQISANADLKNMGDSFFDEQFSALEKEMEQLEEKDSDIQDIGEAALLDFDEDQREFQMAAQSIYSTMSGHSSNNSAKFGRSKFMGLMRNISDGVVTLKKDETQYKYTELYSPTTGEVFGEEYFPVADTVNTDPLANIDDLSNMSSTEAAQKVYENSLRQ